MASGYAPIITSSAGAKSAAFSLLTSGGSAGNNGSIVTASVSWSAGDAIVIGLNLNYLGGSNAAWTATASGLTFGSSYDQRPANRMQVFTAIAASGGSGAITLDGTTNTSDADAYQVIKITPTNASLSFGTIQTADAAASATNTVGSLVGVDADDYQLAFTMLYNGNGDYSAQSGTPRTLWTEIGDTRGNDGTGWAGWVHSQFSPQGGDTTASISGMQAISNSRMIVIPINLA